MIKTVCLAAIVLAVYFPTVFNQFIGDDHLLVETNTFYSSWHNVPRLFQQGNIHQDKDFFSDDHDYGTGYVGYRPVLSLSYFFDAHLWGHKPFGYHLTNIVLHTFNCVLFYRILVFIFGSGLETLFAALLFGLHPIQSEAVAVVGYRADVLASLFVFASFYSWLMFRSKASGRMKYYALSLLMYFLALFTKESTVLLPLVICIYDRLCPPSKDGEKEGFSYYAGYLPFLAFYFYVYLYVFPNSSLHFKLMGGTIVSHVLTIFGIFYVYLMNLLLPWTIKLLPSGYFPRIGGLFGFAILKMALVSMALAGLSWGSWRAGRPWFFLWSWFLIFSLPVSNLIPLANPMSYRFMYLPSAGFLGVCGIFLYKIVAADRRFSMTLHRLLWGGILLGCVLCTLFLNGRFKDDFNAGYTMLEHYPYAATGYVLVGEQYYVNHFFSTARDYFETALAYGYDDPQIDFQLGVCYFNLRDPARAKQRFLNVLAANPHFQQARQMLDSIH